jgi:hypothetical protein
MIGKCPVICKEFRNDHTGYKDKEGRTIDYKTDPSMKYYGINYTKLKGTVIIWVLRCGTRFFLIKKPSGIENPFLVLEYKCVL